ncbi:MAG: DUF2071 domain-containing protein [Thermonemataceae bacterium]
MKVLKKHPFAVEAFFDFSLVLAYAFPKEILQERLPAHLTVDNFGEYGFVAAAMVRTRHLRPKGFPRFLGRNFFLTGYRIFTKYHDQRGKRLRGLYILGSHTDKHTMKVAGNIFTHYHYVHSPIQWKRDKSTLEVWSETAEPIKKLQVKALWPTEETAPLSVHSPFESWKEARRFAGPLPFTFTYQEEAKQMTIIEGVRQHWQPQPVQIEKAQIGFIEAEFPDTTPLLANSFVVQQVPYWRKKGRIEQY